MDSKIITEQQVDQFVELINLRMGLFHQLPQDIQDAYNAFAATKTEEIKAEQKAQDRAFFDQADQDGNGLLDEEECYNYHFLGQSLAKEKYGAAYFLDREAANKIYAVYNSYTPEVEGFSKNDLDFMGIVAAKAFQKYAQQKK